MASSWQRSSVAPVAFASRDHLRRVAHHRGGGDCSDGVVPAVRVARRPSVAGRRVCCQSDVRWFASSRWTMDDGRLIIFRWYRCADADVHLLPPIPIFEIGPLRLSLHGLMAGVGFVVGAVLMVREARRRGFDEEKIMSVLSWALVGSLLGARLFTIPAHLDEGLSNALAPFGSFSIMGGFAGGILVGGWRMRRLGIDVAAHMDMASFGLAIGTVLGRVGDLFIVEHLGGRTDFFLGYLVKPGYDLAPQHTGLECTVAEVGPDGICGVYHHAALYDLVGAAILLGLLYLVARRWKKIRYTALIFMWAAWYGFQRFVIDFTRNTEFSRCRRHPRALHLESVDRTHRRNTRGARSAVGGRREADSGSDCRSRRLTRGGAADGCGVTTDTAPIRSEERFDEAAVANHLRTRLPDLVGDGPISFAQFPGGKANLTYQVTAGTTELVLRRPPLGPVAPGSHDMAREYRVLSVLHRAYPPAPLAWLFCDDPAVMDKPFFVMERRRGFVVRGEWPARLDPSPTFRRGVAERLVDRLADLHMVDFGALGLGDLGRPEGSVRDRSAAGSIAGNGLEPMPFPEMDQLGEQLRLDVPAPQRRALAQ